MTEKQHLCLVICVIAMACPAPTPGQEATTAIWVPGAELSPDSRYLAFFAAPGPPSRPPAQEEAHLFVVDLDANKMTCCRDFTPNTFALTWRSKGDAQLFALEEFVDKAGVPNMRLVRFPPSGSPMTTVQEFGVGPEPIWAYQISALAWNPSGDVLAAGGSLLHLSLSFDGGKSFVRTHTESGASQLRWADNNGDSLAFREQP